MSTSEEELPGETPEVVLSGKRVWVRDAATDDGVRSGQLLHRGSDGNVLIAWDDDEGTALVAIGAIILSA